jgi:hypothetical protein
VAIFREPKLILNDQKRVRRFYEKLLDPLVLLIAKIVSFVGSLGDATIRDEIEWTTRLPDFRLQSRHPLSDQSTSVSYLNEIVSMQARRKSTSPKAGATKRYSVSSLINYSKKSFVIL